MKTLIAILILTSPLFSYAMSFTEKLDRIESEKYSEGQKTVRFYNILNNEIKRNYDYFIEVVGIKKVNSSYYVVGKKRSCKLTYQREDLMPSPDRDWGKFNEKPVKITCALNKVVF